MNYKISTLTPIHVGNGEINASFVYHPSLNDHLNCYRIEDLYQFIDPKLLLETRVLNPNNEGKREIINLFKKHVDYKKLKPQYFVFYSGDTLKRDVQVQEKSLGKPYIPGSSIKGAIMNAIMYELIRKINKENAHEIMNFIDCYDRSKKNLEKELLTYLFGKNYNDILNAFASCIFCEDLYFKTMILCNNRRLNMKGKHEVISQCECIDNLQEIKNRFFYVNEDRVKIFKKKYENIKNVKDLMLFFKESNIFTACRNYYKRLIQDDIEYFKNDEYFENNEYDGRDQIVHFLDELSFKDKNIAYLRIGRNTNYFYKSISIFFRNNYNQFYRDYFHLFAPTTSKMQRPKPDTMPKTRSVIEYDNECYLAGFIKIEKLD